MIKVHDPPDMLLRLPGLTLFLIFNAHGIKHGMQFLLIQFIFPLGGDHGGDTVADKIGQCACLGHEAVDTEYQREPCDGNGWNSRKRCCKRNKTTAGYTSGTF